MARYVLALDQGTSSSRAVLFDEDGAPFATEQREFPQIYPRPGWVEHDPNAIWSSQLEAARTVLRTSHVLAPAPSSPERAAFLQWVHFAETAFTGLGNMAWHARLREDADQVPEAMADYRAWAEASLDTLERGLEGRDFILGDELSGADVMLGYTLLVAKAFGVLGDAHPRSDAYLARLTSRPAFQKALRAT